MAKTTLSAALYSAVKPYKEGRLRVNATHELYYAEYGNPTGIPVVYLHGGPGSGSSPWMQRLFDPAAFRIVLYDQRGAGLSTPFAKLKDNTPDHLVADLDALRAHLGIDKWHVSGGSWGSTLALLYAEAYPQRVSSLTLRGAFMMRQKEIDFLYKDSDRMHPEVYARFKNFIPKAEQNDILHAYYSRIIKGDVKAAQELSRHGYALSRMKPPSDTELDAEDESVALGTAAILTHFFLNHPMTPDNRILRDAHKIKHIPTAIIQGRYDVICPPVSAWELKQALPHAHLQMVMAGHSAQEKAIGKALVDCSDRIRDTGSPLPRAPRKAPQPK